MNSSSAIEQLQSLLEQLAGIGPEAGQQLFSATRHRHLKTGSLYIGAGDRSKRLAFIEQGLIRAYAVRDSGEEATLMLRWEGQFIASHDAIIRGRPSRFIYRALEATTVLEIDYDELERVFERHREFEPLRNFFLLQMLAESLEMIEGFVLRSPEERYRALLDEQPRLLDRVPGKYLASMLGITPVSLSRIRRRLQQRGRH